jgi:hypothetical protein
MEERDSGSISAKIAYACMREQNNADDADYCHRFRFASRPPAPCAGRAAPPDPYDSPAFAPAGASFARLELADAPPRDEEPAAEGAKSMRLRLEEACDCACCS